MGLANPDDNWFERTWTNIKTGFEQYDQARNEIVPGIIWDLWGAEELLADPQKGRVSNAFSGMFGRMQEMLGGVGTAAQTVMEVPVLGDLLWMYDRAITYGVRRPATTLALREVYEDEGADYLDSFRLAWNASERVTPGQAFTWGLMSFAGAIEGEEEARYDPRTPEGRQQYYDDPLFQGTSGSIDFVFAFIDPLKGAGKVSTAGLKGVAAKAAHPGVLGTVGSKAEQLVSKTGMAPTQKMIDSGYLEREAFGPDVKVGEAPVSKQNILSPQYQRVYDAARGQSLAKFQRLHFNDGAFGGTVATVAWSMARHGDEALFADSVMAARGSYEAFKRLQDNAKTVANNIGRQRQALNISSATGQYGTQPAAKQAVDQIVTEQFDAWVDDFAKELKAPDTDGVPRSESFWGTFQGTLRTQGAVRATIKDRLRVGLHDYGTAFAPTVMGRAGRNPVRLANPSARYDSLVNVNSVNAFRNFRYNIDRSALDAVERDALVSRFMLAATAESRSALIQQADSIALRKTLEARGVPREVYDELLPLLREYQQSSVSMMQQSTKHLPTEFKKRADRALAAGRSADAKRLLTVSKEYEEMIKQGLVPETLNAVPAGDRAFLGLIDQGAEGVIQADRPFFRSTTANYMPMMDYRALDMALRRFMAPKNRAEQRLAGLEDVPGNHIRDLLSSKSYQFSQTLGAGVRSLQQVWSIAAILRPAQFIRSMSDDTMRAMTWHGMLPYMVTGAKGTGRLASKAFGKTGITWAQEWGRKKVAVLSGRKYDFEAPELDISDVRVDMAPSDAPGFYQIAPRTADPALFHRDPEGNIFAADFDTMEEALAKGLMPGELYTDYVVQAVGEGRAPLDLVAKVEQYEMGLISQQQFNRDVYEYALDQAGVSSWTNPSWQRDFRDAVVNSKNGVIADPMTAGVISTPTPARLYDKFETGPVTLLKVDPKTGAYDIDGFYDFISAHTKRVVEDRFVVHGVRLASGDIKLSLVRPRGTKGTVAARMTREQRKAMQAGLKRVGQEDLRFNVGGVDVTLKGVFAGMQGNWTRDTVSGANQFAAAHQNMIGLKNTARNTIKATELKDYAPTDKNYGPAWEYTVNQLVANDAVGRLTLEGKSYGDILNWTETTAGKEWVRTRQQNGVDTAGHVAAMMDTANRMVPAFGDLRARALAHDAKHADLEKALPDVGTRPDVLGQADALATGTHPVAAWGKKMLDKWFRVMSDMPIDAMVRYPFMKVEYDKAVGPLVESYISYAKRENKPILQAELDRLEGVARLQALDTAQQVLYDTMGRYDVATAMQYMMPFSNAIADAYFKWARIAWRKPVSTVGQWHRYINAPERMGLVYDEEGYHLSYDEDGREQWTHPVTGDRGRSDVERREAGERSRDKYVLMRVPKKNGEQIVQRGGGKWLPAFNKDSMNPILSLPSAGPIVAVPMNQLALSYPELADNKFMKTFVLPFGPTDESIAKQVTPGLVRSAQRWLFENQDLANSTAMDIFQTWATEAEQGNRPFPTYEEAKLEAKNELGLRFLASAFSPVSVQQWSPYKAYIDVWHQLVKKHAGDEILAQAEFREKYADEFRYLTAHVSEANVSMPATKAGYKKFLANEDLIRANPELAGLITGGDGAGSFNKAVYEWQKTIRINGKPIREVMTIHESVEELELRDTWTEYTKLMELLDNDLAARGLTNLQQKGARDIAAKKQAWINARKMSKVNPGQVSAWFKDYSTTDSSKMDSRIVQMRNVLADRDLVKSRPDLQKLQEYMDERDRYRSLMKRYGYKTLTSQRSRWLADRWGRYVQNLKDSSAPFENLYNRWLTRDELADPGTYEGV